MNGPMTTHTPVFHQATIHVDTLRLALIKDAQGNHYDWRATYPILATLDNMIMKRGATIFPDDCPNDAIDVYALAQLNLPINTGWAIADAAAHQIPAAIKDLTQHHSNPWFRLTPVHWRAGRDQVHLVAFDASEIHLQESKQLLEILAPWLAEWGWHLHVVATNQWFVRADQPFDYAAPSLEVASSDQLEHFLPQGADLKRWQTLLTEIQMAWFNHPVNQAREGQSRLPINSVWLDNASSANQWTITSAAQWLTEKTQIKIFNSTDIHEHLRQLDAALSPVLDELKQTGHSTLTFLGEMWQQDIEIQKPALTARLKNFMSLDKQHPLNWLETPQFDFLGA